MKHYAIIFATLALSSILCFAQDTKLKQLRLRDGTLYKDVTVVKKDPDGLRISHEGGIA